MRKEPYPPCPACGSENVEDFDNLFYKNIMCNDCYFTLQENRWNRLARRYKELNDEISELKQEVASLKIEKDNRFYPDTEDYLQKEYIQTC